MERSKPSSRRGARAAGATGPAEAAAREGELTQALARLFTLSEKYPQIAANQNARALQEELSSFENKIGLARQSYNDIATKYNTAIQVVPGNVIAGFGSFKAAELFAVSGPRPQASSAFARQDSARATADKGA